MRSHLVVIPTTFASKNNPRLPASSDLRHWRALTCLSSPSAAVLPAAAGPTRTLPVQCRTPSQLFGISKAAVDFKMDRTSLRGSPTFTTRLVEAMQKLYPLSLADARWDNVGLLLDNSHIEYQQTHQQDEDDEEAAIKLVLLTNDLTTAVCNEAISKKASVIISYHPIIFRPLKSLTHSACNPQQSTLLRLARHGIAVYSPHTAVDAAEGGINDWLVDSCLSSCSSTASWPPSTHSTAIQPVPQPSQTQNLPPDSKTGYGRLVHLGCPLPLSVLLANLRSSLSLPFLHLAYSQPQPRSAVLSRTVASFAVCAGSGADVLEPCTAADVLVTGELSHHAALNFAERGQVCVMCMHASSERGFLRHRMAPRLTYMLSDVGAKNFKVQVAEGDVEIFGLYDGEEVQ